MKKWICILAVVAVSGLPSTALSVENPGIRNPAGISTVPPSSLGGGLVTSPNPIDRSGNLMGNLTVTGNVRKGRQFRHVVPYNARTDFGTAAGPRTFEEFLEGTATSSDFGNVLGSGLLDSFLRDSAGYEDFGRYTGKYAPRPYFSETATVPTTAPGRSGVFRPTDPRVRRHPSDVFGLEVLDPRVIKKKQEAEAANLAMRPRPLTPDEIRELTSGLSRVTPEREPESAILYKKQLEQIRQDLIKLKAAEPPVSPAEEVEEKDEEAKRKAEREALLRLLTQPGVTAQDRDKGLTETKKLETPIERARRLEQEAIAEEKQRTRRQELEALQKEAMDEVLPTYEEQPKLKDVGQAKDPEKSMADLERLVKQIAELRRKGTGETDETRQIGAERIELEEEKKPKPPREPSTSPQNYIDVVLQSDRIEQEQAPEVPVDEIVSLSKEEVSFRAKQIIRGHDSYESFSKARFQKLTAEAQAHMKQGKYYRAVNAYDQAILYNRKDPKTLAGKSLALFAAGEYMSSALFLSRAVEMSPEYLRTKIDLGAAIGDRDRLETRIVDAEEWLERSCAPELEFLLAYMYYCNGRLDPAKKAITSAAKEMPNSKAVKALKEVIDAAPAPKKGK
ncbi:MAG: tetratricopeptide repeat protein [Planctomycetota bacterium]|jgi:tetratricopeptide (TPR) repeat protein